MSLDEKSQILLKSCHPDLQRLVQRVALRYPLKVLVGYRDKETQNQMFKEGKSKLQWPQGKHNVFPSLAIDLAPLPIDWDDRAKFYHFIGFVLGTAMEMGINIRSGADWDSDLDFAEETFKDLVHIELV